jgi:hypothetical protein
MQNLYRGAVQDIENLDLETPVAEAEDSTCSAYYDTYGRSAKTQLAAGNVAQGELYTFLSMVTSFIPKFANRERPYGPSEIGNGTRSPVPEDLTDSDLQAINAILGRLKDPTLTARLGDILWIRKRDRTAAEKAVDAYLASGKRLWPNDPGWTTAVTEYARSLQLAICLGRSTGLCRRTFEELQNLALSMTPPDNSKRAYGLMNVLLNLKAGDPQKFIGRAAAFAEASGEDKHMARLWWEMESHWQRLSGNKKEATKAQVNAAEVQVAHAFAKVQGDSPSYTTGSRLLAQGIEALRQAGGDKQRVSELKRQLRLWQQNIQKELSGVEVGVDLNNIVPLVEKHVTCPSFEEATVRLALGQRLVSVQELSVRVQENRRTLPFTYLLANTLHTSNDGRLLDSAPALAWEDAETWEEELYPTMVYCATQNVWDFRAAAYIEPARQAVWQQHQPRLSDMEWLARGNQIVPAGHELLFARGLLAGFDGDFCMAAHFLVPQIENAVRCTLELHGVDVVNLMSDLTQPMKISGQILGHPMARDILGEDMMFELRGLLIEKRGHQLRHRLAHGILTAEDCLSFPMSNVWWLSLRLCVMGALGLFFSTPDGCDCQEDAADHRCEKRTS